MNTQVYRVRKLQPEVIQSRRYKTVLFAVMATGITLMSSHRGTIHLQNTNMTNSKYRRKKNEATTKQIVLKIRQSMFK